MARCMRCGMRIRGENHALHCKQGKRKYRDAKGDRKTVWAVAPTVPKKS